MSSSDSNVPGNRWTRHYEEAAKRRRKRGWHRHDDSGDPSYQSDADRRRGVRFKVWAWATALFIVATIVALLLPR